VEKEPEPELAMGINAVTGRIIYGSNDFYITDGSSATLGPVFRYDHPVKLSAKRDVPWYICWVAQAGFLFGKAKVFDSTYFHPKNPSYLPLSAGIYNRAALSVGAELFFWKGLGSRDIWGIKFLSIGYNARNCRINASVERYAQVAKARNGGTVFSFDFLWKLIKEPPKGSSPKQNQRSNAFR
jgi:hypothetical protein